MNVVLAAYSSYVLALAKKLYAKHTQKTLMKLTAGVNFTKVLQAAFTQLDPKSSKRH